VASYRQVPNDDEYEYVEGDVVDGPVPPRRSLSQRVRSASGQIPSIPHTRVRKTGPFGLGRNEHDLAHANRMQKILEEAQIRDFGHQAHTALRGRIMDRAGQSMDAIENDVVRQYPAGSLAGTLTDGMAADAILREREFCDQLVRGLDDRVLQICDEAANA